MSSFVVTTLRIGFLALMWVFILFAANVIRTDMFGRRVKVPGSTGRDAAGSATGGIGGGIAGRLGRRSDAQKGAGRLDEPTRLVVTEGRSSGAEVPLLGQVEVGRAHDSTLQIDDDYASTHHARLWQLPSGEWRVEDLTSTNGTYVNEVRITQPTTITEHDDVRIGRTHLRLEK